MKKQEIRKLTYAQKLALDGEIAYAIATSNHDDEVLYRLYSVLSTVPKELYTVVLGAFERLSNIPEEKIQRVRAEIALGKVPIWIWENKCISDLKECIKYSGQINNPSSITADQKALRCKLVESAFVFFIRKIATIAAKPAYDLCSKILEEPNLKQLEEACIYLMGEISELHMKDKLSRDILMNIMESNFDIRETLSLKLEIKALEMLDKPKKDKSLLFKNMSFNDEVLNAIMGLSEDNEKNNKSIENLINAALNEDINKESKGYVVKKIFNGSLKSTTLETFNTKKEAEDFIKNILLNMPELSQTCTFVIEHQIK